jgi:hypothetical protein
VTRCVADADPRATVAGPADHRQADYYLGLLNELCEDSDRKLAKLRAAVLRHESRGKADDARRCRRMIRTEQLEQNKVQHMIAGLHRRFSRPPSAAAAPARAPHPFAPARHHAVYPAGRPAWTNGRPPAPAAAPSR